MFDSFIDLVTLRNYEMWFKIALFVWFSIGIILIVFVAPKARKSRGA